MGYLKKIVGSQHHRSFSLDWPFEELTRCSLLNRIALGQQATPKEQKDLFKNQANAFANFIEQQPSALTEHIKVVRFRSMGEVAKYLRK
jgi:hypothetical protein